MSNKRVNKMLKMGSCLGLIAAIFSAAALPGMNVAVHAEEDEVEPVKQENLDETAIEATKDILNSDSVSTEDINEFEQSLTEKVQNKEIQKESVQFSGSSEPVVEDNKVTVTVVTEFYNRDGSLSTVKGGTSTYTRAIGSTIDFGTATYNRGWILESETVTGMLDTNPNNYRAQGTVGNEDITIKYVWREDNIGPDGQADKIPDQYQIEVTYDVVNGTWNDGTNDTIYKVYTLFDENGNPSQEGTVKHELPEVGNAPLEGYTIGEWSSNIEYELTHKDDEAHFTYTYSVISDTDVKPSKPSDTENPKNESTIKETKTENKVVNTAYSTNVLSVLGLFMLSLAGMLFGIVKKYLK